MPYMTDTQWTAALVNYLLAGGAAPSGWTTPDKLRLMTTMGAGNGNVSGSNGTELTAASNPGYVALGSTLGAPAFGTFTAATPAAVTNINAVSWAATGTWTQAVAGLEIWDSSVTPKRVLQGTLTSAIPASSVANGDTVQFAAASISADPRQW